MKKRMLLILAILCFIGAGVGFYLSETIYPTLLFALCTVIGPLFMGSILLCVYIERKKSSYWEM